jgi:hypothetical protein
MLAGIPESTVYGMFDLGNKPSVRLPLGASSTGRMRFLLHGRHYAAPLGKPFSVRVAFEDVTGRVFSESKPMTFTPPSDHILPRWFDDLTGVAGLYGEQVVTLPIPAGTTVIDFLGDDLEPGSSPNTLVGYISSIQAE